MKVRYSVAGIAAAAGVAVILTGCGSGGGSTQAQPLSVFAPATSSSAPSSTPTPSVTPPKVTAAAPVTVHPVGLGRTATAFAPVATPTSSHSTSRPASVPALTGPLTVRSHTFASLSNCGEAGTTYYKAPNISVGMDVTLLAASQQLATNLDITPPNAALRGMSNASTLQSSRSLGHGVWQATYRVYTSLYQPSYTPVTISTLHASAGGVGYTLTFPAPVTVTESDCHT